MKDSNRYKKIICAAIIAFHKEHLWEYIVFIFFILIIYYIEFLPNFHIRTQLDIETCNKLNSLASQLSLAYIASYIFHFCNVLMKEIRKNEDYFPQITLILKNLFSVFDSHEKRLASLYKEAEGEKVFIYNKESIITIIDYLKDREKIYFETYGASVSNNYSPISEISGSNYLTAAQISYDIEKLNYFNEVLTSDYKMKLFSISQNLYITSFKYNQINNLETYRILVEDEIELYNKIKDLKEQSKSIFGTDF